MPTTAAILLDPSAHPVIAHRGDSAFAPENTMEAFAAAVEKGADALELDVRLSADGEVVVIHDETVDRTTDGSGPVRSLTVAELRALDAGARGPSAGRGARIPTLDEVLGAFPGTPLLIEVKERGVAAALRRVVERHGAGGRCVAASFISGALDPLRTGPMPVGAARADVAWLIARLALRLPPRSVGYAVAAIPPRWRGRHLPIARIAGALAPLGVPVHVWTINDPAQATALWRSGVAGIVTDDPAAMLAARDRRQAR